jgi:hypothetical protein
MPRCAEMQTLLKVANAGSHQCMGIRALLRPDPSVYMTISAPADIHNLASQPESPARHKHAATQRGQAAR